MGYRVMKVPRKDGTTGFKLCFEDKSASAKKRYTFIKQKDWPKLGFHADMTLEQAHARMNQLNAQDKVRSQEKRRSLVLERLDREDLAEKAFIPPADRVEFEDTRLYVGGDSKKIACHWRAVRATLCALKIPPEEWEDRAHAFFDYWGSKAYSLSYVSKLLQVLNKWGKYQAKKYRLPFVPLEAPRGRARQRLAEKARESANRRGSKKSKKLTPEMLEGAKESLQAEHYNWLLLSVWFGLRPYEVNNLRKPAGDDAWRVEEQGGMPVLWVYQTKLQNIDPEERWKPIPCFRPEQVAALKVIESGVFKQPLSKTLKARFGERITGYAGRKGFVSLMKALGQPFEEISIWMGHKTLDRTYRDYTEKDMVKVTVKKAA